MDRFASTEFSSYERNLRVSFENPELFSGITHNRPLDRFFFRFFLFLFRKKTKTKHVLYKIIRNPIGIIPFSLENTTEI